MDQTCNTTTEATNNTTTEATNNTTTEATNNTTTEATNTTTTEATANQYNYNTPLLNTFSNLYSQQIFNFPINNLSSEQLFNFPINNSSNEQMFNFMNDINDQMREYIQTNNLDNTDDDSDSDDSLTNGVNNNTNQNNNTVNNLLNTFLNPQHQSIYRPPENLFGIFNQPPIFSGLMSELGITRTNYFANANDEFKALIGDDVTAQKLYNNCCKIMLGYNRDFVGFFTDKYLEKAYEILQEHYPAIISKLYDDEAEFIDNIYVPIIYSLYDRYKKEKEDKAVDILKDYIKEYNDENNIKEKCCICIDDIISGKYVKLPCDHEFHYDCVRKWFAEQLVCPVCRHSIEE